ncbi:MAG: ribosomal protein S18-alanine N-acetyltransferase [Chloroflexota bacterium]
MRLVVAPMELDDVPQVLEVDRESYSLPWPASAYRREILHNRTARYFVLRELPPTIGTPENSPRAEARPKLPLPFFRWPHRSNDAKQGAGGRVLGYAGMWLMIDEAHITTIAVRESWRGRGFGELLLASLLEASMDLGVQRVTLEVRVSNDAAQSLYRKYGFREEGVRPRYYSDNNEDAYIMTTSDVRSMDYRQLFHGLVAALHHRLIQNPEMLIAAPPFAHPADTGTGRHE